MRFDGNEFERTKFSNEKWRKLNAYVNLTFKRLLYLKNTHL